MRSPLNRSVELLPGEKENYLRRCVTPSGWHTDGIICADAFEALPLLPDGLSALMIADPPYNVTAQYGARRFSRVSADKYEAFTRRWIEASLHTLTPDASVYVCCDWESGMIIGRVLGDYFKVRNRITWQREKGRGAEKNWKSGMEDIWFATLSDSYYFDVSAVKVRRRVVAPYRENGEPKGWSDTANGKFRDTYPSNYWDDITVPFWSMRENTEHPTQKPEKLMAKLILASSRSGDTVLDPFAGSGSSAVTAKKLGRHYCAVEREEAYCALAQKRLEAAENDISVQGFSDGVFWERNSTPEAMKKEQL